jgi:hypothetical protein
MKLMKMHVLILASLVSASLSAQTLIEESVQGLEVCPDSVPSNLKTQPTHWQICDETFTDCLIAASSVADYDVATCQELVDIDDPSAKKVYFFEVK